MKSKDPSQYLTFRGYTPAGIETYPVQYKVYEPGLTTFQLPEIFTITEREEI